MIDLLYTLTLYKNIHNLSRYIRFIKSRTTVKKKYITHYHHILPKSKDFFPQFRDLKMHTWNGIHLTTREHYVAHRLLHRAFPGSSMTIAFYNMSNEFGIRNSKDYESARKLHIEKILVSNQCPVRCANISKALKGKPKSDKHRQSMIGHIVSEDTKEKLRIANIGKTMSTESREKMSASRKGMIKIPHSVEGKLNIANSKSKFIFVTNIGQFSSLLEFEIKTGINRRILVNIFRNLDKIPRKKNLDIFNINQTGKTWRELGFFYRDRD